MVNHRLIVFMEFLVFGLAMGLVEDLLAIHFATGDPITLTVVMIALLVTIPFAFAGEFLVDHIRPSRMGKNR